MPGEEAKPTFRQPFPAGLRSMDGCFALETDASRIAAVANKDRHAPVLYMTQLRTRGPCLDMGTLALALDQQCHVEHHPEGPASRVIRNEQTATDSQGAAQQARQDEVATEPAAPTCEKDSGTRLLGQRVCDFYEGSPGAWTDFYLAECDCLKRDHVPPVGEVVAACRAKVQEQALATQVYNEALAAGTETSQLRRPPVTVTDRMCDDLESGSPLEANLFPLDERDYFNHLLSRYLTRSVWTERLAAYAAEPGHHQHCTYEPCRDAASGTFHVPYSETELAKGTCNVAQCEARITTQFVRGTVTTRDNIFRVRCSGGVNCMEQNFVPRCSGKGLCQPDGSCDCDPGWTGEDCSVREAPPPAVQTPSGPGEGEGDDGQAQQEAALETAADAAEGEKGSGAADAIIIAVAVACVLVVIGIVAWATRE
jgi:hypothetical protein